MKTIKPCCDSCANGGACEGCSDCPTGACSKQAPQRGGPKTLRLTGDKVVDPLVIRACEMLAAKPSPSAAELAKKLAKTTWPASQWPPPRGAGAGQIARWQAATKAAAIAWANCRGRNDALSDCQPLPWQPDRIAAIVTAHLRVNQADPSRLESTVLAELYPTTRDGVPIPWMGLPADAAPCLLELRRVLRAYLAHLLASANLQAALQRYAAIGGMQ